ncbi:GNAT family N-acetyltransferase [Cryobacterium sp. PH29-G1]|uniref:GNAT family N-acetyltransferase n=1 Tax=Cryobacterium sp. PH29-G1 TaxID=3046211 RepID=UPI0024B9A1A2|nr:GNAT family N-acetyltransferase [Cryobacterium sp. PH29-G1]MDJ0349654.1 GNAT family N-acetyltransferase [Cryobacterium sp. PH29-G1]
MSVRLATPADLSTIRSMLRTHAKTESGIATVASVDDGLEQALVGATPTVFVTVVSLPHAPETIAGLAMWYPTFSSWSLASGIWLEDLFVDDSYRNAGLGLELMSDLRTRTDGRIEWDVSAGNDGAERFYRKLGAVAQSGWTTYRWLPAS